MSSKKSKGTKRKTKATPPPTEDDYEEGEVEEEEKKFTSYQPRGEPPAKKKGKKGPKFDKFQLGTIHSPCVVLQVFDDPENDKTFGATVALFPGSGDAEKCIKKQEAKMAEFQAFMTDDGELSSVIKLEPVEDLQGTKWIKVNLKFNRDDKYYFTDTKGVLHEDDAGKENVEPANVFSMAPGRRFVATVNPSSWTWGKKFGVALYANRVLVGPIVNDLFDLSDLGGSVKEPEWA